MKRQANLLWLLVLVLGGCGGGGTPPVPNQDPPPNSPPPPQPLLISGNWEFTTKSAAGAPTLTISGNLDAPSSSVTGTLHANGWNCFDPMMPIGVTGTLTNKSLVMTSDSVQGQVISVDGQVIDSNGSDVNLNASYTIKGGCADGDQGSVTGTNLALMGGNWAGTFTTSAGDDINISVTLTQEDASPEGSFGLTGTATFDGSCFTSGTITAGTFPSASYILGRSVSLEFSTDNGVIIFPAKWESDGVIRGTYTIVGGSCESTGTGYLSSPWDY
jgi:hypothetical protein